MAEMTEYKPGTFCWAELATSDAGAAKKFYGDLFGWEHHDDPVGEGMVYTMLMQSGKNVGAMYEINEEMKAQNVPPHWLSYVSVASVDDSVAKAKELGAEVPRPAMDVSDIGRMAVLADPTGAYFALWQPKKAHGAQLVNEPVSLCWNELMTTNVEDAGKFYTNLFGWGTEVKPMGETNYTMFKNGDWGAGGMMAITPDMGPVPSNWMVYFAVADCEETTKKAAAVGAQVLVPTTDIPEVGQFSVMTDPQGAAFAIVKMNQPPK
jgi:predicted enzyme related to lactoylglutathione lyase